jgi:hypothetical protein
MTALKQKPKSLKRSDHHTVSLMARTSKTVQRIPGRRIDRKLKDVHGEDQCGLRSGKRTRDAIWMLRIISERTFDTAKELCSCFIDWEKDRTKSMQT